MRVRGKFKTTRLCLAGIFVLIASVSLPEALAHEIVLMSGESFISDQVWEENGKIRFNMHGLVVSVKISDVRTVVPDQGTTLPINPAKISTSKPQPEKTRPKGVQTKPTATTAQNNHSAPTVPAPQVPLPTPPAQSPETTSIHGTGLNGLTWASPTASMPGLVKFKTEPEYGGIDQYYRPKDRLQMGKARLDGMIYGFWRDQLFTITLWVEGKPGYLKLKDMVRSHYGGGQLSPSGIERYLWKDNDTDRMLEFDAQLNTGIFWMRSRHLDRKIKRLYPE